MSSILQCRCGAQLKIPEGLAGRDVRCPKCAAVLKVPAAPPAPAVIPELTPVVTTLPTPAPLAPPPPEPLYPEVDHSGERLPKDAEFFAPPPPEIGTVISGDTTLRKYHEPWPLWAIITSTVTGLVVGLLVGVVAIYWLDVEWWLWQTCWVVGGILVGLIVGFGISSFLHTCVYVGTQGIATITCQNSRREVAPPTLFLFKDADELWTNITHHYKLGIYGRTTWSFEWKDHQGKTVHRLSGTYYEEKGPKGSDPYHLGCAAAGAWNYHLQTRLAERLARNERVRFALKRPGDWIDLAPGSITFCLGAPPVTWTREEIGTVEAGKEDTVLFKHQRRKEGVFSSEGVFTIKSHEMANAQVFLRLLPPTIGFSIQ